MLLLMQLLRDENVPATLRAGIPPAGAGAIPGRGEEQTDCPQPKVLRTFWLFPAPDPFENKFSTGP